MKSICFEGSECDDILMHLGKALMLMGTDTVILDEEGNFPYSTIPVIRDKGILSHDGLLLINGGNGIGRYEADLKCLVTDNMPANARRLEKLLCHEGSSDHDLLIIRDRCGNKRTGEYIANLLKWEKDWVYIRESVGDSRIRCCIQEGIDYRLKDLSDGMKKGIEETAHELLGVSGSDFRRAMGRKKKWGRSLFSDPI